MNPVGGAGGVNAVIALRQQVIDRSSALQSLREDRAVGGTPDIQSTAGGGFANTLQTALQGVNETQTHAADMTAGFERGEIVDVAQVMLARQEAGVAFEATLQVRNKLLNAYQDIMRMGV